MLVYMEDTLNAGVTQWATQHLWIAGSGDISGWDSSSEKDYPFVND